MSYDSQREQNERKYYERLREEKQTRDREAQAHQQAVRQAEYETCHAAAIYGRRYSYNEGGFSSGENERIRALGDNLLNARSGNGWIPQSSSYQAPRREPPMDYATAFPNPYALYQSAGSELSFTKVSAHPSQSGLESIVEWMWTHPRPERGLLLLGAISSLPFVRWATESAWDGSLLTPRGWVGAMIVAAILVLSSWKFRTARRVRYVATVISSTLFAVAATDLWAAQSVEHKSHYGVFLLWIAILAHWLAYVRGCHNEGLVTPRPFRGTWTNHAYLIGLVVAAMLGIVAYERNVAPLIVWY